MSLRFSTLTKSLFRQFAKKSVPGVRTSNRFRPALEQFEGRVVPATDVWLGGPLGAPTSWSLGRPPTTTDDVLFDGSVSNAGLALPAGFNLVVQSVRLVNNYSGAITGGGSGSLAVDTLLITSGSLTGAGPISANYLTMSGGTLTSGAITAGTATMSGGTMTLNGGMSASTLSFSGGTIDQPNSGSDITVNSAFTWSGGTLNSTSNLADVTLNGATGLFAPTGGGTVYCGNNITLTGGASAEFNPGEYVFTNNGELTITSNCAAEVNPVTIASTVKYVGVKQINLVGADSLFRVTGPGTLDGTLVPFYNSDGLVDIRGSATVQLGGAVTVLGNIHQSSYYQDGTGGRLHIENGSNLVVEKTAKITDGVLKTFYNPNLADNVTAQTATLTGDLWVSGGAVEICAKELLLPKHYGTFYVTETVHMSGGTYAPGIDSTTSGANDHWESGENFTVAMGNTATLTPRNSNGANTVANGVWNIIKSRTGTYSGTFATTNLQYTAGPPPKSYTFNTGGNPVNQVNLTS